jgi:2-haloacid dehalogenase
MNCGDRWVTFDCYGTLIDWNGGIRDTLASLWPDADPQRLLTLYHRVEPLVQGDRDLPYREVLRRSLRALSSIDDLRLDPADEGALADSLPDWSPFPEVAGALTELRRAGWRLAVLSNTDPDLLASSLERIGVPVDERITAADAGSYKPAAGHWEAFFRRTGADPSRHIHVAASLYHDIEPAHRLGMRAVWINRLNERSTLPRAADLPDLTRFPATLSEVLPS